jgi:hypothetical protein
LSGTGTVGGGGNVATCKQAACLQKLAESRYTLGRIFPWAWSWAWAQARGFILSACLSSLSCLPLPPSASPAPERCCFFHANNPTILQSSCAVCLSVVSQQAIRPIRSPQAPFPSPGPGTLSRWQLVLLYLTDPYGKSPRHFEPSGCLPLLAPRNIQLPSGTHCTVSLSRTRSTRITHHCSQ